MNMWPDKIRRFLAAFGGMMAAFSAVFLLAPLFMDASAANFESAEFGLLFAVVVSAVFGLGAAGSDG